MKLDSGDVHSFSPWRMPDDEMHRAGFKCDITTHARSELAVRRCDHRQAVKQ